MAFTLPIRYTDTPDTRVLDLEKNGAPGVPVLGLTRISRLTTPVLEHVHPGVLEFGLCLRGALTLNSSGQTHTVMPGNIYVNQPGIPHRLTVQPRGLSIYWMHVKLVKACEKRGLLKLPPRESKTICDRLSTLPPVVSTDTRHVRQAFTRLFQQYESASGTYRNLCIRQTCITLLIELLECTAPRNMPTGSERLDAVIARIRRQPESDCRIDDLAREAALSPTHFINQFKQVTGLPPIHFLLECRIDKAKCLLSSTSRPITVIAISLGFSSSQHFSNQFRRATGMTPRAWRARGELPD